MTRHSFVASLPVLVSLAGPDDGGAPQEQLPCG